MQKCLKVLIGLLVMAAVVWPQTGWAVDACEQDRPKVCGGVAPGHGEVHNCMLANIIRLSPDCQNTVQQSETLVQQFLRQCQDDTRRFCSTQMDLRPNDVVDCMKAHKEDYSMQCQRIYKQLKAYDYPVLK